jgi:hypothetical protein
MQQFTWHMQIVLLVLTLSATISACGSAFCAMSLPMVRTWLVTCCVAGSTLSAKACKHALQQHHSMQSKVAGHQEQSQSMEACGCTSCEAVSRTHLSNRLHDLFCQLLRPRVQLLRSLLCRLQLLARQALRHWYRLRLDLVCQWLDNFLLHLVCGWLGLQIAAVGCQTLEHMAALV